MSVARDYFIIRDTCVRLQNDRQGQLRWQNGRVPTEARRIERRQFFLKSVIKESITVMPEKDKQFRSLDALDDCLLKR